MSLQIRPESTNCAAPRLLSNESRPRIIAQMRIKNEERWLKDVLDSIARVADGIVILDDGSTDSTPEICRSHPAVLDYCLQNEPVQDQVRDKNHHQAMALALKPDWILSMDGDEILEQSAPERIWDAIRNCPDDVCTLGFEFLYMWNDLQHYRVDGPYKRIVHPRLYKLAGQDAAHLSFAPTHFQGNGHCKSVPANLRGRVMEADVKVLHLGYMYADVRRQRYERYRTRDPKEFARGDYEHLLDQPGQVIIEWRERPWRKAEDLTPETGKQAAVKQEFKPDYYYANARKNLADLVPQGAKRVLDVGCGQGLTGGLLRTSRGCEVTGIEIHPQVAETAAKHLDRVIVGDLETMELPFEKGEFDCILLGDVLEHLVDPWQALKKLVQYLNSSGTIVASIPNIRNLGVMKKLLDGSWAYEEWGILDKTHLRFFALKDMLALFEQAGIDAKVAEVVRDPLFEKEMKTPPSASTDADLGTLVVRNVSPQELDELTAQQFIFTGTLKHVSPQPEPQQAETGPEVSIIIPVFNNLSYTRQCITSLFTVKEEVSFEVVVVDNGSTDGTAEYLNQLPSVVRTVSCGENLGFAKGCNAGAKASRGNYLVFLNNDTVVQPEWLSAMLDSAKQDSTIGLVGNLQIFPDTGKVQQAGIVCGANHMVYSIYNNELSAEHPAVNKRREFQFVAGSCMLIAKSLFDELDGFDEAYLNSCEDIDLCMKVRESGRKVFYCPESKIVHYESRTVKGHDKNGANYSRFLEKWGDKLVRDDFKYLQEDGMMPASESQSVSQPRVAILTTYNQHCGVSTYAEFLVAALKGKGCDPVILAEKTRDTRGSDPQNVIRCWSRDSQGGTEVVAEIHRLGIRVLHVNHGGMFALNGWLPDVLRELRRLNVRIVTTFHSTECDAKALGELVRLSDRVLVHHAQNELELLALEGTPERIEVVPHGMPEVSTTDIFEAKLALGWDPAQKVVSTFGFVEPHKGIYELIAAMKPVYDKTGAHLHVLGGAHPANPECAGYLAACKQKAHELGMAGAVHFAEAYLPDAEVQRRLQASDVIALNYLSHRYESSGAAMIALSSGRPVVTSSVPTFEFAPGSTYKTTDHHHLGQAIHDVLTNPFIALTLMRNLRDYEKTARWDVVAERIMTVYEHVLQAPAQSEINVMHYYRSHPDEIYAEPLQRERVRWLKSKAEGRILEIGPANGYVSDFVGGAAGVDINRGRLAVAQLLRPSVHFQYGDAVKGLPFAEKEFDTVLAPEIFEHVDFEDAVAALKECARVGKRVLVTLPNADKPDYDPSLVHNVEHRWLVNRETVDRLLAEAGCASYELDTSEGRDFYLLDVCTDSRTTRALIHPRVAELCSQSLTVTEPLHVGLDLSCLNEDKDPLSETNTYAMETAVALMAARPQWKFTVYGREAAPCTRELLAVAQRANGGYQAIERLAMTPPDVVYLGDPLSAHGADTLQKLLLSPALVTCAFSDLIPLKFADVYLKPVPDVKTRYLQALRLLKERCDLFFCTSQSTAQDLQAQLQIGHGRLRIVHGAARTRQENAAANCLAKYSLEGKRTLLSVGAPEFHKNVGGMLFALSAVRQVLKEDLKLVIVANIPSEVRRQLAVLAAQCALPEDALVIAGPEDAGAFMRSSVALLQPSLREGAALHMLNAMAAGLPVITADNSAQAEVGGNAVMYVNPQQPEDYAMAMLALLRDSQMHQELRVRGMVQARRFTWKKTAEKTAVYLAESAGRQRQLLHVAPTRPQTLVS